MLQLPFRHWYWERCWTWRCHSWGPWSTKDTTLRGPECFPQWLWMLVWNLLVIISGDHFRQHKISGTWTSRNGIQPLHQWRGTSEIKNSSMSHRNHKTLYIEADSLEGTSNSHALQTLKLNQQTLPVPRTVNTPLTARHHKQARPPRTGTERAQDWLAGSWPLKNQAFVASVVEPKIENSDFLYKKAQ